MSHKKTPVKPQRTVFISDLHVGSAHGLRSEPTNKTQVALLTCWKDAIVSAGLAPDLMVVNGDAVTGQDRKTMAVQETDTMWQLEDAERLIKMWNPRRVAIVEGTPYHTGDTIQLEKALAHALDNDGIPATFHTKFQARINGWFKLQARHKIGRSEVPYGQHTAPSRALTHQVINAALQARHDGRHVSWPHLSVYGHVHYYSFAETAKGAAVTLPCWQALGDRFGDTQCDGHVDLGVFWVDVGATEKDGWKWQRKLYPARVGESRTLEL
jgi:metallophosphoesterase superfamily enzyme